MLVKKNNRKFFEIIFHFDFVSFFFFWFGGACEWWIENEKNWTFFFGLRTKNNRAKKYVTYIRKHICICVTATDRLIKFQDKLRTVQSVRSTPYQTKWNERTNERKTYSNRYYECQKIKWIQSIWVSYFHIQMQPFF